MSRRSPVHHEEEESGGMERWLLTYSDMITLLLALFIVLFAMSTINLRKFAEFATGRVIGSRTALESVTSGGNGLLHQTDLVSHAGTVKPTEQLSTQSPLQTLEQKVRAELFSQGLDSYAHVLLEQQGVIIRVLSDKVFFANDSAALGPVGYKVVDAIGKVISGVPNNISVRGYTDDAPILGGPYTSNFQLSAERAISVLERLVKHDGVNATRISGTGYGDTHALVPNNSPAHMAENRRVDVVILSTTSKSPKSASN